MPLLEINPELDLVFERTVETPPEKVWAAWTTPKHLMKWFTPAPWKTVECEIDLRPGGKFYTVMESPEGQRFPNTGCYLELVKNEKLVWTNGLTPGYRPAEDPTGFAFSVIITLEPQGTGTKYRAVAMHKNVEGCEKHRAMNFEQGWGKALDQLVEHAKTM